MMTGRFMQWAAKRGLDRLLIVNKIDADNVDLEDLLERIQQTFGKECLPLNLPPATARGSRLLLRSFGRSRLLVRGRGAPQAGDQVVESTRS